MSYQVLARKWRPRNFQEVVGQEHVVQALVNALDHNRLHHAFLFSGTRGVGKTTLARILAKALNCDTGVTSTPCGTCASCTAVDEGRFVDLIEVDAASRTKIDDTRELLDNVQYAPTRGRYKVYLIDEVHMLSGHSFNALLKTLEEPPPHVKFLLATTDPQKLPVTVLSRCLQFNLKPLDRDRIADQLHRITEAEQVRADGPSLALIARAAAGSMRDALSLLDQAIAHGGGELNRDQVASMLGTVERTHIAALMDALANADAAAALAAVGEMAGLGVDFDAALDELLAALYMVALCQVDPQLVRERSVDVDESLAMAARFSPEDVQLYYQLGMMAKRDMPLAPDPRTGLEMGLLRMIAFRPDAVAAGGETPRPAKSRADAPPAPPTPAGAAAGKPAAATEAAGGDDEWRTLVSALELGGLVRELANHSALEARDGENFRLVLDAACARLHNREREASLREALGRHLGKPVRLEIRVGAPPQDTPARIREREQDERMRGARASIESDPNVQSMMRTFGARIDPESVRPED